MITDTKIALEWWAIMGFQKSADLMEIYFPNEYLLSHSNILHIYNCEHPEETKEPLHESLTRGAKIGIAGYNEYGKLVSVTMQEESPVSLEDAAKKYAQNQSDHFLQPNDKTAFKQGGKFRDEQYSKLIEGYSEALEALKDLFNSADYQNIERNFKDIIPFYVGKKGMASDEAIHKAKDVIEKSETLLNNLKK